MNIVIVNTLGAALHHYTAELKDCLEVGGADVVVETVLEPSQGGGSSRRWLLNYLRALRRIRRASRADGTKVVVTWPLLGYVDVLILRLIVGSHGTLIIHDTKPMVKSLGYGLFWQHVASLVGGSVGLVVHSQQALGDIGVSAMARRAVLLPHPILQPESVRASTTERRTVRVLGQYKPDRDVAGLRLAALHFDADVELSIVGRGWPDVQGWSVRSEFVPESELEDLIREASAVVIPYTRFYQSGIAMWCLEVGTPFVGPAGTSLEDLLGAASPLLIKDADGWASAIAFAVSAPGRVAIEMAGSRWRKQAVSVWAEWSKAAKSPKYQRR